MNFDPAMILWATLICVVLTILRAVLNRRVFTVSFVSVVRRGGREGGRERKSTTRACIHEISFS